MAVVLGSMQVTNRLDLEDANTKQIVLGVFIAAQFIVLIVHQVIQSRINAKNDTTPLVYTEPPKPFSGEEPKLINTTVKAYDLEQNSQARNQVMFSLVLMIFLHIKFDVIRPLVVQAILPLKSVFESKWAQVHLFGKAAEGDLKRPWKGQDPLSAFNELKEGFKNEFETPAIEKAKTSDGSSSSSSDDEPKVESKKDI